MPETHFYERVLGFGARKVVPEMTGDQLKDRIERGEVTGGMLPKLHMLKSLKSGVQKVHLVDGRVPHNLIGIIH